MPTHKFAITTAFCLTVLAGSAHAQDPQKIVDQYVKAAGGSKALSNARTITIEGTFHTADGKAGTYTLNTRLPNRFYSELVAGDTSLVEAYNGKSAWHRTANGEFATLVGAEGSQLEAAGQYYNSHLVDAKKNKIGLGFAAFSKVRGRDALEIEATTMTGVKRHVFFDPQTHLIVKEAATVGGIDEQILYDDYRLVNGLQIPYKIKLHRGTETYKLKEHYAGTRSEEETEFDKTGKISKRELHEYTFFYLSGHEVSTLVKKDGKPLSEEEQKKENEKVQKEIRDIEKRDAKKEAKEEKAKDESKEKKEDDDVGIETFLRACQFVNHRRERFRGQDVLVFDFEPNP